MIWGCIFFFYLFFFSTLLFFGVLLKFIAFSSKLVLPLFINLKENYISHEIYITYTLKIKLYKDSDDPIRKPKVWTILLIATKITWF